MIRMTRAALVAALMALVATVASFSMSEPAMAQGACGADGGLPSIAAIATAEPDLELLVKAADAAGLVPTLSGDAALTVFAPNDAAFVALANALGYEGSDETEAFDALVAALTELGGGDPLPTLTAVLQYHLLGTVQNAAAVTAADTLETIQGGSITVDGTTLIDAAPALTDASIIGEDVAACNGVVHLIDQVMLPIAVGGDDDGDGDGDGDDDDDAGDDDTTTTTSDDDGEAAAQVEGVGVISNDPGINEAGGFGFGLSPAASDGAAVPAASGDDDDSTVGGTGGGSASAGLAATGTSTEAGIAVALGLFAAGSALVVTGRRRLR